ncbi:hypothetical protein D1872_285000 [compost metagenome]
MIRATDGMKMMLKAMTTFTGRGPSAAMIEIASKMEGNANNPSQMRIRIWSNSV